MLSVNLMNIDCNMRRAGSKEIEIGINITGGKTVTILNTLRTRISVEDERESKNSVQY